jgi:uncharacterized membrane protein YdjX (TVP38/TMEM64 family)
MLSKILLGTLGLVFGLLWVFPIALVGYMWGQAVVSFKLGLAYSNLMAARAITRTLEKFE